ncbi:MAG: DUF3887 domain-containing protein [Saprospiraceae bacterium]
MKNILTFLILTLMINISFGQTEKATYKTVADEFEKNYNSENFKAIFESFSSEMQSALPFDNTSNFLSGLKQQAGKITK